MKNKFVKKIKVRFYWLYQNIVFSFLLRKKLLSNKMANSDYSIGITTFLDRYNIFFKPLITKTSFLFPDKNIIVVVNGHVRKEEHIKYLDAIADFIKNFNNIHLIKFIEPQGLSKLWNEVIRKSDSKKILILNDDINLAPTFRKEIESMQIPKEKIAVINRSWAHFLISKEIIDEVGWFDENLLEIGGEDDDYAARLALMNIPIKHYRMKSIANYSKPLKLNSFGKDMTGKHRYSEYNTNYLLKEKWITSDEPFEGSVYVPNRKLKYWKLRTNS